MVIISGHRSSNDVDCKDQIIPSAISDEDKTRLEHELLK